MFFVINQFIHDLQIYKNWNIKSQGLVKQENKNKHTQHKEKTLQDNIFNLKNEDILVFL